MTGTVWEPAGLAVGAAAPLVIVHDGPEYDVLGGFTHYLGASIGAGLLPPSRVALLAPGDRNYWYAANPVYARALRRRVLPALEELAPTTFRVGVGVSLGALALLHAHWLGPGAFDGLFLQSGSYFTPALDPQERDFSGFPTVTAFVAQVQAAGAGVAGGPGLEATVPAAPAAPVAHTAPATPAVHTAPAGDNRRPIPVVLTCGIVEENLANNRLMTATLRRLGYPATLVEVRDAHNYTAWRDCLDPHLATLVASLVGLHAA